MGKAIFRWFLPMIVLQICFTNYIFALNGVSNKFSDYSKILELGLNLFCVFQIVQT
mgnify:CR=1 FL=1